MTDWHWKLKILLAFHVCQQDITTEYEGCIIARNPQLLHLAFDHEKANI